ncbi:MAG: ATP-dependent sacrificial sulfur transferase LarE [Candidatus Eisenbacteria bacterium]
MNQAPPAALERARIQLGGDGHPLARKLDLLAGELRGLGSMVIAFSGGVDSTFLLAVASAVAPESTRAVLGVSPSLSAEGHAIARRAAAELSVELIEVATNEVEDPAYLANEPDRCFHCKSTLYTRLHALLDESRSRWGSATILDGTNRDDLSDTRPGRVAAERQGVRSPLADLGWSKSEIRQASRALGLSTWDRPASPCLSSRVPHGTRITEEVLRRVESAEAALRDLGFRTVRVRHHDALARIEVPTDEVTRVAARADEVAHALRAAGYRQVTLDLAGYRTGGADGPDTNTTRSASHGQPQRSTKGAPDGDFEV